MIFFRPLIFGVFMALLAPFVAHAQTAPPPTGYFSAQQVAAIDSAFDLSPSQLMPETQDWDMVAVAIAASPTNLGDLITREATPSIFVIYGPVLGPDFTAENHPELAALAARIFIDAVAVSSVVKARYARLRPYDSPRFVQLGLSTCVSAPTGASGSFPSGHALMANIYAGILAEIYPAQQQAIYIRAEEFALPRVACGLHFPSDLLGGGALAVLMLDAYQDNSDFRANLAALVPNN